MKTLRNLFLLLVVAVVSIQLASCVGDDDDMPEPISGSTYATYMSNMAGSYTGKLYYWNEELTDDDKTDSVSLYAYVKGSGDSLITASVPASVFANSITDNDELRDAMSKMENITLKLKYYLYYEQDGYLLMGIYPQTITDEFVDDDGESHTVEMTFYNESNYTGWYMGGILYAAFYLTELKIDDNVLCSYMITGSSTDDNAIYYLYIEKY